MENTVINSTNVFVEITEIFKYIEKDILEKIPQKVRDEIKNNCNPNYRFEYDPRKSLNEQNIKEETKDLLSALYLMYCCDETTKNEILKICKENEDSYNRELAEKYSYEKLFKNRKKATHIIEDDTITDLVVHKEENIFTKIINKIKSIFKR